MLIMYNVLKKYDPYEPCHISGTSRAINLKLLQVTPIDKNMLTNDILVKIISLYAMYGSRHKEIAFQKFQKHTIGAVARN